MAHHVFVFPGQGVKLQDAVDLIPEKLHPDGKLIVVGKVDIHRVPFYAELVADKVHIVALILQFDQLCAQLVALHLHTGAQADDHTAVVDGVAQRVNAGHACHNNDVAPLRKRRRCRMAQTVDLVIDGAVLFYIGIGGRDVGFGLVVVVVAYKIFHRVLGEKAAHLGADLACQRFVRLQDQGRAVAPGNDICHRKRLAGAGNAQQRLCLVPCVDALHQRLDGLGLVTGGLKRCL